MSSDDGTRRLIEVYAPQPDTCVFHLDESGARILDFVSDPSEDERDCYLNAPLDLKVIPYGGLLYVCHAFESGSWNDAPVNYYSDELLYQRLIESQPRELTLTIQVVDLTKKNRIACREALLSEEMTATLLRVLQAQRERGLDELMAIESLGEPGEMIHLLSQPGIPEIQEIKVDSDARTVQVRADMTPPREKNEPRARWILRSLERFPTVDFRLYSDMAAFTTAVGEKPEWRHCFFPVGEVIAVELERTEDQLRQQLIELGADPDENEDYVQETIEGFGDQTYAYTNLAVVLNWHPSQGVYRFDQGILKNLYLTTLPIHLDPAILTRLPEYCVYVETPGLTTEDGELLHGFFAMIESVAWDDSDDSDNTKYFSHCYISLDHGPQDRLGTSRILRFDLNKPTLKDAIETLSEIDPDSGFWDPRLDLESWITPLLSQLLYICSTEPEIRSGSDPQRQPTRPMPKKTRKGYRLFPPTSATVWECGWRTGAAIRFDRSRQEPSQIATGDVRRSPRGHVRRAHWHVFYAGPKDASTREVRLHWLSMINVNLNVKSDKPTVIRPIKQDPVINPS
jgi:hypothetical protein